MRTYGRVKQPDGSAIWQEVSTQPNGSDDYVWVTTLAQCLLLMLNESPFYADYGIPAYQMVAQQIMPDFYVARMQQRFAVRFASLLITRIAALPPTYKVSIILNSGTQVQFVVPL